MPPADPVAPPRRRTSCQQPQLRSRRHHGAWLGSRRTTRIPLSPCWQAAANPRPTDALEPQALLPQTQGDGRRRAAACACCCRVVAAGPGEAAGAHGEAAGGVQLHGAVGLAGTRHVEGGVLQGLLDRSLARRALGEQVVPAAAAALAQVVDGGVEVQLGAGVDLLAVEDSGLGRQALPTDLRRLQGEVGA